MARLKLQAPLLDVLEQEALLPFNDDQRKVVSAFKSGTNYWFQGQPTEALRVAVVAAALHKLKEPLDDVARLLILVPRNELAEEYLALFDPNSTYRTLATNENLGCVGALFRAPVGHFCESSP